MDPVEMQVDLVKVMERSGLRLIRQRADGFKALCPFHNEKVPSFSITPSKRLWHCFGCNLGGTPTQFVQRYFRLSHRAEAVELIRAWGLWPEADEDNGGQLPPSDIVPVAVRDRHEANQGRDAREHEQQDAAMTKASMSRADEEQPAEQDEVARR